MSRGGLQSPFSSRVKDDSDYLPEEKVLITCAFRFQVSLLASPLVLVKTG